MTAVRPLRIASAVELLSLIVLLANLATVHLPQVSSLMGPVHGCAYLWVVVGVHRAEGSAAAARVRALVPGVGGVLALRRLSMP
ncbi:MULTISPECIES: DUF3817 domain-containing protein [unclassified Streptomyces]|uniref:DUF3817 domain-containing protein n=1 Tax=unclassified Streptomyces TaxID=2593676 RepID=UPI0037F7FEEC